MAQTRRLLLIGGLAVVVSALAGGAIAYFFPAPPSESATGVTIASAESQPERSAIPLAYDATSIGEAVRDHPMIPHVAIADLDADGLNDVLACDGQTDSVRWLRQNPRGVFTESVIGDKVAGPVHVSPCDLDRDGDLDLLVASMGIILPNNDRVGSVVVLENRGAGVFHQRVLLENTARVTDVRGADLNNDGRTDLVVGQFGYLQGEICWLEQIGAWEFRRHALASDPGTVHTPVADFNHDGRPDFAALVAQDAEEIRLYLDVGNGYTPATTIWKSLNRGWSSSGLETADIDGNGWPDLVYTNGDGFDAQVNLPSWHGLQWLENHDGSFTYHRIDDFPGCYSPAVADLDGDRDLDIVAVSAFNNWQDPAAMSLAAWVQQGNREFTRVRLANVPTHLITVAAGDLDGDGVAELVTGGFHAYPPWTHLSRITLWRRR